MLEPHELDEKLGFDIGWDYGCYGITPLDTLPQCVRDGARAAMMTRVSRPSPHDRFVRKWLLLRVNAWRRGRAVDPAITPDFLRSIDFDCCPITRERLTHGTGELTDWSVDRVQNDGAYSPYNIVIMSARANKAKGSKSLLEVRHLATDPESTRATTDLDAIEWMRLYYLMCYSTPKSMQKQECGWEPVFPMLVFPTPSVAITGATYNLQYVLSSLIFSDDFGPIKKFVAGVKGKKNTRRVEKFIHILRARFVDICHKNWERMGDEYGPIDETDRWARGNKGFHLRKWALESAWTEPGVVTAFLDIVSTMTPTDLAGLIKMGDKMFLKTVSSERLADSLHLDTQGYVPEIYESMMTAKLDRELAALEAADPEPAPSVETKGDDA